jgi:two-component system nitrogen regulation sensor histidine kinase NtrY
VVLEVIDNGPGIPDDQKGRVFDPYFTNKKGGTGLGLAIVNSIVADHQGRIRIFDNIPSGVRFVVEIPLEGHRIKSRRV